MEESGLKQPHTLTEKQRFKIRFLSGITLFEARLFYVFILLTYSLLQFNYDGYLQAKFTLFLGLFYISES